MKIAAVFGDLSNNATEAVTRMCEAQRAHEWHKAEVFDVESGAIGIVRTSERYGKIPMLYRSEEGNILAISGVPTFRGELLRHLNHVVDMCSEDAAEALAKLDGAYAALFWHANEEKLLLVTDFMGFQPIYLHRGDKGIAIASEIKAFCPGDIVPLIPDPAGWGAFIVFGHTVGEPTQLKSVSRVRGIIMRYEPSRNELYCYEYWKWPQRDPDITVDSIRLPMIIDFLKEDIAAYQEYGVKEQTVLMSSGFDSRLILCLLIESEIFVNTLSVQQKGHYLGAEGKLGQKVARTLGVKDAKLVDPLDGKIGEIAQLRYMVMNDVATPSLSLFISKVAGYVNSFQGSVWEGFAPNYTITQMTAENMEYYLNRWDVRSDAGSWKTQAQIFSKAFLEVMKANLVKQVQLEFEKYGRDDYGVMRFIVKNRALNRTGPNPFKVYANTAIPFVPGLSKTFWDEVATLPPLKCYKERLLYKRLFKELFPKIKSMPFCSEANLFTVDGRFHPEVHVRRILHEIIYKWERRHKIPFLGPALASSSIVNVNKKKPDLILSILEKVSLDDPCLNPDAVRTMLTREKLSPFQKQARNLIFYWTLWNLAMRGEIKATDCEEALSF